MTATLWQMQATTFRKDNCRAFAHRSTSEKQCCPGALQLGVGGVSPQLPLREGSEVFTQRASFN